jgi:hypothetical protein
MCARSLARECVMPNSPHDLSNHAGAWLSGSSTRDGMGGGFNLYGWDITATVGYFTFNYITRFLGHLTLGREEKVCTQETTWTDIVHRCVAFQLGLAAETGNACTFPLHVTACVISMVVSYVYYGARHKLLAPWIARGCRGKWQRERVWEQCGIPSWRSLSHSRRGHVSFSGSRSEPLGQFDVSVASSLHL